MSTTYNTILKTFKGMADSHQQINNFGNGVMEEINTFEKDGKFPILWIVPQSAKIGGNSMIYTLRVMVFDICESDDSNEDEILSDTVTILNDILLMINNELATNGEEVYVLNQPLATPFRQKFVDYCVGWYADFQIEVNGITSGCQVTK
jgi:hypothetical protein